MKKKKSYLLIAALLFFYFNALSQVTGTWKGNSICQVKNSPCHDEIAVYYIKETGKPNIYHMVLDKVVNGVEEFMGESDFAFTPKDSTLTWIDEQRNGTWKFTIKGKTIEGTAVFKGVLYRVIHLELDVPKKP